MKRDYPRQVFGKINGFSYIKTKKDGSQLIFFFAK